jgi:signal transduction histidine kinase
VGVLRSVDADPFGAAGPKRPEPPTVGLAQIESLVATTQMSGLDVTLDVLGDAHAMPPAVELTVYRIVQQSLTNVVQHAQAKSASVTLKFRPDDVVLSVVDDGRGEDPDSGRAGRRGFGVMGMHERAAAIGGQATIGPKPGGGYRVTATLPYSYEQADAS